MNKILDSFDEAVADIPDDAIIMVGGAQGPYGTPQNLLRALQRQGAKNLTVIGTAGGIGSNAPKVFGYPEGFVDSGILVESGQVKKVICGLLYIAGAQFACEKPYESGQLEAEISTHGNVAARIWAGGAGIPAFYTPTGVGTVVEEGKEKRIFNGREYILEHALTADYALVWAYKADKFGNLVYRGTGRNYNPVIATAAKVTIVEAEEIVEPGELDPEVIITPGIYINRIIKIPPKGGRT